MLVFSVDMVVLFVIAALAVSCRGVSAAHLMGGNWTGPPLSPQLRPFLSRFLIPPFPYASPRLHPSLAEQHSWQIPPLPPGDGPVFINITNRFADSSIPGL